MAVSPTVHLTAALERSGGIWTTLLFLADPLLQYAVGARTGRGRWECEDPSAWRYSDGVMRLEASIATEPEEAGGPGWPLTLRATAQRPTTIQKCAVVLEARCAEPPYLIDQYLRWRQLRTSATSSEWTPFLVRWRDRSGHVMELRAASCTPAVRLDWRRGLLRITIKLDTAALHPRWSFVAGRQLSTASPIRPAGWEVGVRIFLRKVDTLASPPVVASRFPGGREAAFIITDHCDFDTVDAFRVFLEGGRAGRGWLGRGLRFTKGVFTIGSPDPRRATTPTLEDPDYRSLVERLHHDGSEIAPHGVNERGNIEPERFREALEQIATAFSPRTWIDHGCTLDYCYSMGGADNPAYRLNEELRRHGIDTLWAYQDAPVNPVGSLNLLAVPSSDMPQVLRYIGMHLLRGNPLVAARYGRSMLLERTTGRLQYTVGHLMSAARRGYIERRTQSGPLTAAMTLPWDMMTHAAHNTNGSRSPVTTHEVPFTRDDVIDMVPTIYPERAVSLSQLADDDLLLFTTMEVLHTEDAYTRAALDRLLLERGLHIAHTYLLNRLPYVAGIFADARGEKLSRRWLGTLQALAEAVASSRLWNPTMGELAGWVRRSKPVTIIPLSEHAVEVRNPLAERVVDYTLLLPATVAAGDVKWDGGRPAGTRSWGNWLSVWGEVPSRRRIEVRWG